MKHCEYLKGKGGIGHKTLIINRGLHKVLVHLSFLTFFWRKKVVVVKAMKIGLGYAILDYNY